ncbi:MAG: hypothetical protein IIZ78_09830 [Clostridiales bacterium]|nr:hypothetical protein [Clostridiales bacterium]
MTDREIIKALVNVIEPSTETEKALKQIIVELLDSHIEAPKKVDTKVKAEPKAAAPKKKPGRKPIDWPKAEACRKAGWSIPKIADELNCAEATVYNHFKSLEV